MRWVLLLFVIVACTQSSGLGADECQYTETYTSYENTVGITHESGTPLGAESVHVDDLVSGAARGGERCRYSFSMENREEVPLKLNVRYLVEDSDEEKFLLVELDPLEKRVIEQTHPSKERCGALNGSFRVRFLDAQYIPRTEAVDDVRCRLCDGVVCKNDGADCTTDAECGSQRCEFGTCVSARSS